MITTAHAHKSGVIFLYLPETFQTKKFKKLRPKMTKIASSLPGTVLLSLESGMRACTEGTGERERGKICWPQARAVTD